MCVCVLRLVTPYLMCCPFMNHDNRSHVATENEVNEAVRLFTVSTMDAARSGINQQVNLTAEIANEIKVWHRQHGFDSFCLSQDPPHSNIYSYCSIKQQAETQIKRRIPIGNQISERRLIDDLTRMGMNESIVSICFKMSCHWTFTLDCTQIMTF